MYVYNAACLINQQTYGQNITLREFTTSLPSDHCPVASLHICCTHPSDAMTAVLLLDDTHYATSNLANLQMKLSPSYS